MGQEETASEVSLAIQSDEVERSETPTIMVVDDEPGIVRMLQTVLERRGFSVVTADSGKVALDLITTRQVDLVVLDIMMPELDGITTCRHLKADPVLRHIPVILLTAKDSLRDKVFGLEMGADDYMTKPFSGEELIARINVQLRIRRMAHEVMRRNRELAILNAVAEAVGRSLHRGEVLRAALEKIGEMEEIAAAYILLQDPEAGRLVVVGQNLADPREEVLAPVEAKILREGLPHCYSDVSQVPDLAPIPVPTGVGSFLIVPLTSQGSAGEPARDLVGWTGLLGLFSHPTTRFGGEEVRLFSAVGRQLTMALQNTHLFTSVERQVRQTQALYHVSASVISSQAVDQVMRAIVERFLEAMQVDRCAITLHVGETAGHLIVGYDRAKEEPWVQGIELSLDRHPEMRRVLETRQPLIIPDVAKEPLLEPVRDILLSLQIRSILAIPLLAQEKSIGVITLNSRGPVRHFTQGEIDFCQTLGNQAALAMANARLFEQTQRQYRGLQVLHQVAGAVNQTLDLDTLLQIALDKVQEVTGKRVAFIRTLDRQSNLLVLRGHRGLPPAYVEATPTIPIGMGGTGWVLQEKRPLYIPKVSADPRLRRLVSFLGGGEWSYFCAPLMAKGEVIGTLSVASDRPDDFTPEEQRLIEAIASPIGVAAENARLFQETTRQRRETEILAEIGKDLTSSLDLEAILQKIVAYAQELCRSDIAFIAPYDPTEGVATITAAVGTRTNLLQGLKVHPGKGTGGQALLTGKPFLTTDYLHDPRLSSDYHTAAQAEGFVVNLAMPILRQEEILGLLWVVNRTPRSFSSTDEVVLGKLAAQAAIAIENAKAYQQIQRHASTVGELYKATLQVSASLDLDETLHKLVESVVAASQAASSNIILFDELGQVSHLVGWQVGEIVARPEGLSRQVWETGRPVVLPDFATVPPDVVNPQLLALGRKAAVCLPLLIRDKVRGVMWVHYDTPRRFADEDLYLLSSFANQAAIAIENARLFAETRRLANTDELTGLYNHRHFYHLCGAEVNRARRYDRPFSLIMLDIDHFKQFNDQYGHLMGDEALRRLAQILRKNSRGVDMVARYGGEEFAIILPETDLNQATIQAERIRSAVAEHHWPQGRLTISLGVASLTPDTVKVEDLVHVADQALYQAKAGGRNQVSPAKIPSR